MACSGGAIGARNKKALVRRRRARPAHAAGGCVVCSVAAPDVAGPVARRSQRIGSEVERDRPQGARQCSMDGDVGMVHVRMYKRQHKKDGWGRGGAEVERAIEH